MKCTIQTIATVKQIYQSFGDDGIFMFHRSLSIMKKMKTYGFHDDILIVALLYYASVRFHIPITQIFNTFGYDISMMIYFLSYPAGGDAYSSAEAMNQYKKKILFGSECYPSIIVLKMLFDIDLLEAGKYKEDICFSQLKEQIQSCMADIYFQKFIENPPYSLIYQELSNILSQKKLVS